METMSIMPNTSHLLSKVSIAELETVEGGVSIPSWENPFARPNTPFDPQDSNPTLR